jgi:hypothetical protein
MDRHPVRGGHRLGLLVLLVCVVGRLLLLRAQGGIPLTDDALSQVKPWYTALFREILAGRLPEWTPEIYLGFPLLASAETHVFSPLNLPFLVFATETALALRFAMAMLLAATGAYLLARQLGTGPAGALGAGLLWATGNHVWVTLVEPYSLATFCWFPLIWMCWDRVLTGQSPLRWTVGAGLAGAAALLGGHLQHVYHFGLLMTAMTIVRAWLMRPAGWLRLLGASGLAITIALGASAVTVLPTLDIVRDAQRSSMTRDQRLHPSLDPAQLPDLLFPPIRATDIASTLDYGGIGWLPIAIALMARGRARPLHNAMLAASAAFLLLSAGGTVPGVGALLRNLPAYDFRNPDRAALLFVLPLSILFGAGIDTLARPGGLASRRDDLRRAILVLAIPITVLAWCGHPTKAGNMEIAWAVLPPLVALVLPVFIRDGPLRSAAVVAIVVASLTVSTLGRSRVHAAEDALIRPLGAALTRCLENVPRWDAWGPVRTAILPAFAAEGLNVPLETGHHTPGGYASLAPRRVVRLLASQGEPGPFEYTGRFDFVSRPVLLDLLNVGFLVASDKSVMRQLGGGTLPDAAGSEESGCAIVRRTTQLPRSFYVRQATFVDEESAAWRIVNSDAFDPRTVVVIEAGGNAPRTDTITTRSPGGQDEYRPARVVSYQAGRVEVEVDAPQRGWLVLLDGFSDGWSCRRPDRAVRIFRADYAFGAVEVEAGRSRIVFEYRNRKLRTGAAITALTLALAAGALLAGWRRGEAGLLDSRAHP